MLDITVREFNYERILMKVILREEIKGLGKMGDIVNVADGYGRNYLIPSKKAVETTTENVRMVEREKKKADEVLKQRLHGAEGLAKRVTEISLTLSRQGGEGEKMFCSFNSCDIDEALITENINIDKKQIHLEKPIKELGLFHVPVRLHPEVTAELKVWVVKA